MIARLYNCDNNAIIFDNCALTIEIENPNLLTKIIDDLRGAREDDIEIAFESNNKLIKGGDIEVIIDYQSLSFDNKSITNKIIGKIENEFKMDYAKTIKFNELSNNFKLAIIRLLDSIDIELKFDEEPEIRDALNYIKVKPENFIESLTDKIMQYINIVAELNLYKIICFVNLKAFIDKTNIEKIIQYSLYKKLPIILFEYKHSENNLENEIKLLIDKDYCDIMLI